MEKIKSYKDLKIWQKSIEIVTKIYQVTKDFPKEELYSLTSQMRRSAISIPSNIAEGFMRQHNKEYKQFLYVALGSNGELETQLIISKKLKYIDEKVEGDLNSEINYLGKMITSLIKLLTTNY